MRSSSPHAVYTDNAQKVVLIGVAADSGCGKSTFMRRLTSIFGGDTVGPLGGGFENGGWETNSLVSDLTTVLCLDDYHLNDRGGRKVLPFAFFVGSVSSLACRNCHGGVPGDNGHFRAFMSRPQLPIRLYVSRV